MPVSKVDGAKEEAHVDLKLVIMGDDNDGEKKVREEKRETVRA